MMAIRKIRDWPILHFDTDGEPDWADIESARLTIRLMLDRFGSVYVLETSLKEGDQCCVLVWDQIVDQFSADNVPAVAIVADIGRVDVFSSVFVDHSACDVRHLGSAQSDEAMRWLRTRALSDNGQPVELAGAT